MEKQYKVSFIVEGYSTPSLHIFDLHEIADENGMINSLYVLEVVKRHYMHAVDVVKIEPYG